MASKKEIEKQELHLATAVGSIVSIWFADKITDQASCEKGFDLKPHAAVCLALMTTQNIAASKSLANQLGRFGFNVMDRAESHIFVAHGMDSLLEAGLVELDDQGDMEYEEVRDLGEYGVENIHWTLTRAGAKRMAPFYCSYIGKPSEHQAQAIEDMLTANKAEIQKSREEAETSE